MIKVNVDLEARINPGPSDPRTMTQTDGQLVEYARACLEATLSGLTDDATDNDVLGPAQLGLMALHMHYGSTDTITLIPTDVLEYVNRQEPVCICPADMVARGGYRSTCPASHDIRPDDPDPGEALPSHRDPEHVIHEIMMDAEIDKR